MDEETLFPLRTQAVRALAQLTGLPFAHCSELADAVYKRRPALKWIPSFAAAGAAWGWMYILGRTTDALEGTRWDVLSFLRQFGLFGTVGWALLSFGIAVTLFAVIGILVPRAMFRRQLFHHLYYPACFWCGYLLRGLQRNNASIQCPECGRPSPVRLPDEHPTP